MQRATRISLALKGKADTTPHLSQLCLDGLPWFVPMDECVRFARLARHVFLGSLKCLPQRRLSVGVLIQRTAATPAGRYFGLVHDADPFFPVIFADWIALGMDAFGAPRAPESGRPPYHWTHRLVTDIVPLEDDPHDSTAVDFLTPLAPDGTPILLSAWDYLLGVDHAERR